MFLSAPSLAPAAAARAARVTGLAVGDEASRDVFGETRPYAPSGGGTRTACTYNPNLFYTDLHWCSPSRSWPPAGAF